MLPFRLAYNRSPEMENGEMIKQIVNFDPGDGKCQGTMIEISASSDDPKEVNDMINFLIKDGAVIEEASEGMIRAAYRGTNRDKLLALIQDGWILEDGDGCAFEAIR